MRVLFLHGWHSVPGGIKPTYLKNHGHTVINPALDDDDFAAALATAQVEFDRHQPAVVVGSSRGGAVAMNLNSGETPLVLLCPAWKTWGTAQTVKPGTVILHSRADDVVPFADSAELIANSGLAPESLLEVGRDHRLADEASLSVLLWVCGLLASHERLPLLGGGEPAESLAPGKHRATMREEASYVCDACGEEIIIPLDLTAGASQTYVEDCPVCCRANVIHVESLEDGDARVWAEPEQDRD